MYFNERDNQLKFSHSDFEAFSKCEKMWALNQDKTIKKIPSAPLVNGSAFHSTLESIIRGSREPDLLAGFIQLELQKRNILSLGEYREKDEKFVDKIIEFRDRIGPACVVLFNERILPKLRPQAVEYWATRDLYEFDGKKYALHCKIDYLDESEEITDWKTTSESPAAKKIKKNARMQASINMFCDRRDRFRFAHFGGSGKNPALYEQSLRRLDEFEELLLFRELLIPMIMKMEEIHFGGVAPIPNGGYRAAYAEGQCDYCDYRDRCRHGACEMVAGGKVES